MTVRLVLMLCLDALLAVAAVSSTLCLCIGYEKLCHDWSSQELLRVSVIFAACELFASYLMDVYTLDRRCAKWEILIHSFQAAATSILLLVLVYYLIPSVMLSQEVLLVSVAIFCMYQFLWHAFSVYAIHSPYLCETVLILGTGPVARQLGELIATGESHFALAGYLQFPEEGPTRDDEIPPDLLIPREAPLLLAARKRKAGLIVVAVSERRGVLPLQEMMQCKLEGVKVVEAPTFYEMVQEKLMLEEMTPGWIVFSPGFQKTTLYLILKRCSDMVLSLIGLLLCAPFFPFIALAIKLDSPGPVLFKQARVGSGERTFTLYKFRSMRQDAERNGAVWASEHDSRVTRIGRLLRQYRIDEIPQLYNVLKGDMSFIGPRPERPEFVQSLKEEIYYYSKRHTLKPGLTGWAQVRYPYGASVEDAVEKLRYDLYYIKNHSFLLDSRIILETMKVVVFGGGR